MPLWYRALRWIVRQVFSIIFHIDVRGSVRVPEGAVIVAANHFSAWDPPLVGVVLPRALHFMAKEELFRIPLLGRLLRSLGAFPVRRDFADSRAVKTTLRLLREGHAVAMFPEGTRFRRGKDGRPGPARAGIAVLAAMSGAPVLPLAIRGQYRFRGRIGVAVGEPLRLPAHARDLPKDELQALAESEIMARIRALWDDLGTL